jgi:organic hydroperoxide reductase OsmC/OhrA
MRATKEGGYSMHMRNQKERRFQVNLKHQTGFRFVSQASEDGRLHGDPYVSDEPDPIGDASGPSTPALLASAIGHCLSASLLEALRHSHVEVLSFETEAVAVVKPNAEGLPRIDRVDVRLRPMVKDQSGRAEQCAKIFEKHCTVCSSLRKALDIRVSVDWQTPA